MPKIALLALIAFTTTLCAVNAALSQVSDQPAITGSPTPALGQPFDEVDLPDAFRTIWPDGRNLPEGRGGVAEGAQVYAQQCASCHGATGVEGPNARLIGSDGVFGFGDPLRPVRINSHPILILSAGGMWPHATSLFAYVRRAMPYGAPGTLTDNEIYAVTAWLLYRNGVLPKAGVLDRSSLPQVSMPGAARVVLDPETAAAVHHPNPTRSRGTQSNAGSAD
jgi:cytochrome c553